jgi:uncharacterized membrane protein
VSKTPEGWSTPRFFLVVLLVTFAVLFFGNGICNEILELGVPMWVFSGTSGALLALVFLPRWRVMREMARKARK